MRVAQRRDPCPVDVGEPGDKRQAAISIAKTLRIYSENLRTQRRQQIEEIAAKMAVKLVFPLVFFIFPSIFVVALGPSLLAISDSFNKYFK